MPVRQVQADEVQGHRLREVRRGGDRLQSAPRADGPHRAGGPGRPYLVPEVAAEPHRPFARHAAEQLERILYFESYVVIEPGLTALEKYQLLTEDELLEAQDQY